MAYMFSNKCLLRTANLPARFKTWIECYAPSTNRKSQVSSLRSACPILRESSSKGALCKPALFTRICSASLLPFA
jgi:hypothetical protein